jgi:hypothetical protein
MPKPIRDVDIPYLKAMVAEIQRQSGAIQRAYASSDDTNPDDIGVALASLRSTSLDLTAECEDTLGWEIGHPGLHDEADDR